MLIIRLSVINETMKMLLKQPFIPVEKNRSKIIKKGV
jgi:hypothetical protein